MRRYRIQTRLGCHVLEGAARIAKKDGVRIGNQQYVLQAIVVIVEGCTAAAEGLAQCHRSRLPRPNVHQPPLLRNFGELDAAGFNRKFWESYASHICPIDRKVDQVGAASGELEEADTRDQRMAQGNAHKMPAFEFNPTLSPCYSKHADSCVPIAGQYVTTACSGMRGRSKYHSMSFKICTSHVERLNGTQRLFLKRLHQLSYCFSKKLKVLSAIT